MYAVHVWGFFVETTLVDETHVNTLFCFGNGFEAVPDKKWYSSSPLPEIIHRNGDFQKTMERMPRLARVSFWKSNWKLSRSVWGVRRTRFQPARFQRRACKLKCCSLSSVENTMRLTSQHNEDCIYEEQVTRFNGKKENGLSSYMRVCVGATYPCWCVVYTHS